MREIKFRAWDKDEKRMIYLANNMGSQTHLQLNNHSWGVFEPDSEDYYGIASANSNLGDILMQHTGLKDKNGIEIYEGDIVIFNHIKDEYLEADNIFLHNVNRMEYQKKYVVEFCNTYYRYGVRFRNGSTHFMVAQATITNHNVEVIGNIHERSIAIDN